MLPQKKTLLNSLYGMALFSQLMVFSKLPSLSNLPEMMISCTTPLYSNNTFIGALEVALSMSKTKIVVKDLVSTPGGLLVDYVFFNLSRVCNAPEFLRVHCKCFYSGV